MGNSLIYITRLSISHFEKYVDYKYLAYHIACVRIRYFEYILCDILCVHAWPTSLDRRENLNGKQCWRGPSIPSLKVACFRQSLEKSNVASVSFAVAIRDCYGR